MSIDWKLVYTDSDLQRISLYKGLLEESGIPAQIINKIDSAYPSIGSAELYADATMADKANAILEKAESTD